MNINVMIKPTRLDIDADKCVSVHHDKAKTSAWPAGTDQVTAPIPTAPLIAYQFLLISTIPEILVFGDQWAWS